MKTLTITPAVKGGYVVAADRGSGYMSEIQFAGTLQQCLAFIEAYYASKAAT